MKKNIFILISSFMIFRLCYSQNNGTKTDDYGRITISAYVPSDIGSLNAPAQNALKNRLDRMITKNGLGGASYDQRFILTAKVQKLSSNKVPSTPPVYDYEIEVTFIIGDAIEGTIFSSLSTTILGSGNTESSAEISAIKKIKESSPEYQKLIDEGKKRIIEYYNSKCDFILKEAQTLASQNNFDEAIYKLTQVPEVCKDCYSKAMDAVAPIYQKQIDRQCKISLNDATNAWNTNQNSTGADQASSYLSNIDPNASCYKEAQALSDKIVARLKEIDQREWNFKLKQQQDDADITKERIKAARDIGVAYGNNQPKTITTYNIRGWW